MTHTRKGGAVEINETFTTIGVFLGTALAAYIGYFRKIAPPEKHLELAGALVDATAVKQLAAAIEAHTLEAIAQRQDAEKSRQIGYRMVEAVNKAVDEVAELRHEIGDLAKEIARSK